MEMSKNLLFLDQPIKRARTEFKAPLREQLFIYTGDTSAMKSKVGLRNRAASYSEVRKRGNYSGINANQSGVSIHGENEKKREENELVEAALMQAEEEEEEEWKEKDPRYKWIRGMLSAATITLFVFYGVKWLYDLCLMTIWGPLIPIVLLLVMGIIDILVITAGVLVKKAWRNYGLNLVICLVLWSVLVHIFLALLTNELDQMNSQINVLPFYFSFSLFYIVCSIAFLWIHKKHEKDPTQLFQANL